jgi:hypothetical protein
MCIAILNTKKAGRLPKTQIKNSWDNNDMGSGLLWNKDGKLNVFKTYEYDEYIDMYNKLRDDSTIGNIVLHFRIATSGYNGEHNLHPFLVNDNLGFVHNGVIRGLGNKKFSDTYEFNDMLKKYKHDFLTCEMSKFFISEYIGHSKLIFLDRNDKYTIINEDMGKWTDGNWYSNDSYKEYNNYVYYGNTKVSKSNAKVESSTWDDFGLNEWEMYDYICDIYGLDPNDDGSFKDIEYYMALNNAKNITEFYNMLVEDYNL